ncbi:hypothetical protein BJV78DRAFT_1221986 [Lactifluus subvellereus]|nr:hypothetical protein BJV78DRAFT_1221986 [Lactifluus subvellereus]
MLVAGDMDLESVPREAEEGLRERRVLQSDQWTISTEQMRRAADVGKERKGMGGRGPRNF